jgi:hypothetical protein
VRGGSSRGWPGTKTKEKLKAMGVTLAVKQNDLRVNALDFCIRPGDMRNKHSQRVVAALEEDWVELRVKSNKGACSVGNDLTETGQPNIRRISVGRCCAPAKSATRKKQKRSEATVADEDMDNNDESNVNQDELLHNGNPEDQDKDEDQTENQEGETAVEAEEEGGNE